jgi:large subunit ribosomal protein L15
MGKTKTKKFRGSRTCGGGTHKNRRGAGSRGGRGNAGGHKHHYVRSLKRGFVHGKRGFKRQKRVIKGKTTINVGELDEMVELLILEGKADEKEEGVYVKLQDIGIEKILGGGKTTKKLFVMGECSANARKKIEDLGGKIIE